MKQFLLYARSRWVTEQRSILLQVLGAVVGLFGLYAVGLFDLFNPQMEFEVAEALSAAVVLGWCWFAAWRSLSALADRRTGVFYAMLGLDWQARFVYHALLTLVVVPLLLWGVRLVTHAAWFSLLVEPDQMVSSTLWLKFLPFGTLTLFYWFSALFFAVGSVARRYGWIWCLGILMVLFILAINEDSSTSSCALSEPSAAEWEKSGVVLSMLDPLNYSILSYVLMWGMTLGFVGFAAYRFRRMQLR